MSAFGVVTFALGMAFLLAAWWIAKGAEKLLGDARSHHERAEELLDECKALMSPGSES